MTRQVKIHFTIYFQQLINTISLSIVVVNRRILMEKSEKATQKNIDIFPYPKGIYFFLFEKGNCKLKLDIKYYLCTLII